MKVLFNIGKLKEVIETELLQVSTEKASLSETQLEIVVGTD